MTELRLITVEDILDYNHRVGECYFDQNEGILYPYVMLGFIIAKRPNISIELLRSLHDTDWGLLDLLHFFEDGRQDPYKGYLEFVELFVECINSTEAARERVIESLGDNNG